MCDHEESVLCDATFVPAPPPAPSSNVRVRHGADQALPLPPSSYYSANIRPAEEHYDGRIRGSNGHASTTTTRGHFDKRDRFE
jgi:hypothetical protein